MGWDWSMNFNLPTFVKHVTDGGVSYILIHLTRSSYKVGLIISIRIFRE